jgi:hypothetical protein
LKCAVFFVILYLDEREEIKMVEKNLKKLNAKKQRVLNGMNTGTRTHKTDKYPTRQQRKQEVRKEW